MFDVRKNTIEKTLLTNEVSYSAQEHWQLNAQCGVSALKHRIHEMKIKNILATGSPATFFHSLVKNPFVSQCFHSAEGSLCSDTGVCRYPQAASGEKKLFSEAGEGFLIATENIFKAADQPAVPAPSQRQTQFICHVSTFFLLFIQCN